MEFGLFVLIYNGEIYNFCVFCEEFGVFWNSEIDFEVIFCFFVESGLCCVERLIGMFVFVIWDCESKMFFVVCDCFGIKFLYYCIDGGLFVFVFEFKGFVGGVLVLL